MKSRQSAYMVRYSKFYRAGYRLSVPALGYERRLQALAAIGYPWGVIAERMGGDTNKVHVGEIANGHKKALFIATAKRIEEVYHDLCLTPNPDYLQAKRIKTWAKKRNWAPPMAWNDIDDPNDVPVGVEWPERICATPGCTKAQHRREWCEAHYTQWRKAAA